MVDSSKGPDLRKCDRTRSVNTDRTLSIQRPVEYSKHPRAIGRVRSLLTGPYQRPVTPQRHITVRFSAGVINTTSARVWGYFCSFQQLRNTLESAKKSKVLVR